MEAFFEDSVKPGPGRLAAGFCFAAINRDGTKRVQKSYGTKSIEGSAPFPSDPFVWLASLTKLVTTIAALQCVERGLFALDDAADVAQLVPELAQPVVITDFEPDRGNVSTIPAKTPITARMLLSHVSGCGYDAVQPALLAWRASRSEGQKWLCGNVLEAYNTPLVAEPGTAFNYSPGLDWIGLMIERVTDQTLGQYFRTNIFDPLHMNDTLFDETTRPDLSAQLIPPTRKPTPHAAIEDGELPDHAKPHCEDDFGGAGLYSTASNYLTLLSAVLRKDSILLKDASYASIMTGNLNPQCRKDLNTKLSVPFFRQVFAMGLPDGIECDFSAGALVLRDDVPGMARAGTIGWISITNSFWLIDPTSGYCAVFLQQLHPCGDAPSDELRRKVREYLWQEFGAS